MVFAVLWAQGSNTPQDTVLDTWWGPFLLLLVLQGTKTATCRVNTPTTEGMITFQGDLSMADVPLPVCLCCADKWVGQQEPEQLTSNQRLYQTKMSLLSGTLKNVRFTDKKWSIKEGQNNSIKKPKFPSCWLWLIQGGLSPQRLLSPAVKHWPNTSQRKCKCFGCPVPRHP